MALLKPGDTAPRSGFFKCIRCKKVILLAKGQQVPQCPSKCEDASFSRTEKTIPPLSQIPDH